MDNVELHSEIEKQFQGIFDATGDIEYIANSLHYLHPKLSCDLMEILMRIEKSVYSIRKHRSQELTNDLNHGQAQMNNILEAFMIMNNKG